MVFEQIYGHESQKQHLLNAYKRDRIPSAYLFSGDSGVGKSKLVAEFARLINCEAETPCHTCSNCKLFDLGGHPDFQIIEPDGQFIKISQIHALISNLSLKPAYASKRVVLVKEAHRLNQESANSFLKILEEPPLDTLIVLITSDENLLLETILSRCQKIVFSPLSKAHLEQIILEKFDVGEEELAFVLNYSGGRIRKDFLSKVAVLNNMRRQVLGILQNVNIESMSAHFILLDQWIKKGLHDYFFEFCCHWLKDFLVIKANQMDQLTNADMQQEIANLDLKMSQEQLQWAFDLVIETELGVRANAGKPLALESLLIQMKQVFEGVPVI
jgi:DNA polymerase III subunit delta'